eukprot:scaffold18214_cov33-Attheya_sp.AAC.4
MQFSEDKTVKDVPFDNVCTSILGDSFDLHRMKMEVVKYIFSRIKLLPGTRDSCTTVSGAENYNAHLSFEISTYFRICGSPMTGSHILANRFTKAVASLPIN